jgi:hypothetical protein
MMVLVHAITQKQHPTDQELIDLAIELHSNYPSYPFDIVDSASVLSDNDVFINYVSRRDKLFSFGVTEPGR